MLKRIRIVAVLDNATFRLSSERNLRGFLFIFGEGTGYLSGKKSHKGVNVVLTWLPYFIGGL
jgi:hypothetical protein